MAATGAINENRKSAKDGEMSHLMHAVWGLYHYPNYLQRWRDAEIEDLEGTLEALLSKVREQRATGRAAREALSEAGGSKAQRMRSADRWTVGDVFAAPFAAALGWAPSAPVSAALGVTTTGVVELDGDGIYDLELFTPDFCAALADAIDDAIGRDASRTFPRANLDHLGFSWVADAMLLAARAVARIAFPDQVPAWRHAYVLDYAREGPRTSLVPHTDDAEITLNVPLTDGFRGGDLLFGACRGDEDELTSPMSPVPRRPVGTATCHIGRHLHAVAPVTAGHRKVLICWTRAPPLRARVCPCCWMNRRFGDVDPGNCISGPVWTD